MNTLHHNHFVNLVKEGKDLRTLLKESKKIKMESDVNWLIIEAVPFDEDMLYCYDEVTFEQYVIPFKYINKNTTEFATIGQ